MTNFFIGDVAIDEYYATDHWPEKADKGSIRELSSEMGGSIANAAVVHAALGEDTQLISLLNHSALSELLITDLKHNGVGVDHMLRNPMIAESRNLIFLVDGEHIVLTIAMGEQPMWLPAPTFQALCQPGFLYTTLYRARRLHTEYKKSVLAQAALLAHLRRYGRRMIFDLDVAGCSLQDMSYLVGASVIIFNQIGFQATFGHNDISRIRDWIREHQIGWVVHSLAARGAEASDGKEVLHVPCSPVEVVDVTGAGDTLGGALTWGISQQYPFGESQFGDSLTFAVAAAQRSVTIYGPRGGRASRAEINQWRKEQEG